MTTISEKFKMVCKRCGSKEVTKNGKIRNKQRYKCKKCGLNFVSAPIWLSQDIQMKYALIKFFAVAGNIPLEKLAKMFNMSKKHIEGSIKENGRWKYHVDPWGYAEYLDRDYAMEFLQWALGKFEDKTTFVAIFGKMDPQRRVILFLEDAGNGDNWISQAQNDENGCWRLNDLTKNYVIFDQLEGMKIVKKCPHTNDAQP